MIVPFIILSFLVGCTSSSPTATELYHTLDKQLSKEDQLLLTSFQSHIQRFVQLNQELEMLLEEMKNNDELEAAVETMEIATEEAMYIFNLIELEDNPTNKKFRDLKFVVQASIEDYMEAMKTQLEGITTGDQKKTDKGFKKTKEIYKEFSDLLKSMKE